MYCQITIKAAWFIFAYYTNNCQNWFHVLLLMVQHKKRFLKFIKQLATGVCRGSGPVCIWEFHVAKVQFRYR